MNYIVFGYISIVKEKRQGGQEEMLLSMDGTTSFSLYLTVKKSCIWHQL